jgi:hypothetical protein
MHTLIAPVVRDGRAGGSTRVAVLVVTSVLVAGAIARLWGITGSLWIDEFSTLWVIEGSASDVAERVRTFQGQTPLYYYAAWVATHLLGESEVALRLPSLIASLLTAIACGWAAGALAGRRAAVLAFAFAWLLHPAVQAAVNARPYGLAIAGVALGIAGYVVAATNGNRLARALVVAGLAGAFWVHFLFVIPIVGVLSIHVLVPPVGSPYRRSLAVLDCSVGLALCAPAWPWVTAALSRPQHVHWRSAPQHLDAVLLVVPLLLPWLLGLPARTLVPPAVVGIHPGHHRRARGISMGRSRARHGSIPVADHRAGSRAGRSRCVEAAAEGPDRCGWRVRADHHGCLRADVRADGFGERDRRGGLAVRNDGPAEAER